MNTCRKAWSYAWFGHVITYPCIILITDKFLLKYIMINFLSNLILCMKSTYKWWSCIKKISIFLTSTDILRDKKSNWFCSCTTNLESWFCSSSKNWLLFSFSLVKRCLFGCWSSLFYCLNSLLIYIGCNAVRCICTFYSFMIQNYRRRLFPLFNNNIRVNLLTLWYGRKS